jgi:hypothetical protein
LTRIRSRLTYANVMATLAFLIAVAGGTAYAANTVFSTDIVNGEVKTPDLATNAVTSGKIANGQVKRGDLDPAAITGGITQVVAASENNTDGNKEVQAQCPAGKEVVSGGYVLNGGDPAVYRNYAVASDTWLVRAIDFTGSTPWQLTVTAVCVG